MLPSMLFGQSVAPSVKQVELSKVSLRYAQSPSRELVHNPAVLYHELRKFGEIVPVSTLEGVMHFAVGYRACEQILKNSSEYRSIGSSRQRRESRCPVSNFAKFIKNSMIFSNGEFHKKQRSVVESEFISKEMEKVRPLVASIAAKLVTTLAAKGNFDLMQEYAFPLTTQVICAVLGIKNLPQEELAVALTASEGQGAFVSTQGYAQATLAARAIDRIIQNNLDSINATQIGHKIVHDPHLTKDQKTANLGFLFVGAIDTTAWSIGNIMEQVLQDQELQQTIRKDSTFIPQLVREGVRYAPSVHLVARIATSNLQFGEYQIAKGDKVIVALAAANRDPTVFEQPDLFNIHRKATQSLSFGRGEHVCLGQFLSRIEMEEGIKALLSASSDIQPSHQQRPEPFFDYTFRGFSSLPVTFCPR